MAPAAKRRPLWSFGTKDPTAAAPPPGGPLSTPPRPVIALPLLLAGTSAKEGEIVARSGGHPEQAHGPPAIRREVVCFDCQTISKASAKATSTQCSNCGTFIDLRDVEIKERSTQRIRTRGNVTIHKKGALLGTAVHCGSLIVEGAVSGSIYAQDTVDFRADAKILGEIRCRHLAVNRRITLACLQPVHLESLHVAGKMSGRVFARGLVHLERHATFEGALMAARLLMESGAGMEANLAIFQKPDPS
jgi:cytoskeletal protein CcmA (bactofilin family)